jgi:hypothetical protein
MGPVTGVKITMTVQHHLQIKKGLKKIPLCEQTQKNTVCLEKKKFKGSR